MTNRKTKAPIHHREDRFRVRRGDGLLTAVKALLEMVVVALFVAMFLVQPMQIPSASMEPTLMVGDFVLVDTQSFAPAGALDRLLLPPGGVERGDLVVFYHPVEGSPDTESADAGELLVKRVVGVPGDRLRLREGRVLIDGEAIKEPYAYYSPSQPNNFRDEFPSLRETDPNVEPDWWIELRQTAAGGELTVPPGRYFVLGDNRNDSEDSRYWGFVRRDEIVGRPLLVYFSQRAPEESADASLGQRVRALLRMERKSFRVLR